MITLASVRNWLKTLNIAENYYIGKLDRKYDKSIGVYSRQRAGAPIKAIGDSGKYDVKAITILLHWTTNADDTERAALLLWDKLQNITNIDINETHINYLALNVPEPVAVGVDDNGVYEYVIEADFYYQK